MSDLPAVSAIVLAGGRSRRFGRDKLREPVDGRPLLHHAIEAVAGIASDVVVVTAPLATPPVPDGIRVVEDAAAFDGPLRGCLTGLLAAREPLALVVGGDMPALRPAVLELLVRTLDAGRADAVALEHLGEACPLPLAVRTGAGTEAARRLLAERERRLRALVDRLTARTIDEGSWRPLDPTAETLLDIDEPGDLGRRRPAI